MTTTTDTVPAACTTAFTASTLLAAGWPVLPLHTMEPLCMAVSGTGLITGSFCSCARGRNGETCQAAGKHPRHHTTLLPDGLHSASIDPARIAEWWGEWPGANVAIVTGDQSDLCTIDVDPKNGGTLTWAEIVRQHPDAMETLHATTGSGGTHCLFQRPRGIELRSGRDTFGAGVDFKGDNSYIVAAPSLHKSGQLYAWDNPGAPVAMLPQWAIDIVSARAKRRPAASDTEASRAAHAIKSRSRTKLPLILEQCAWMRHCHADAATLPEIDWYRALSIVVRCEDGERLAHEMSATHPDYSRDNTAEKLQHALHDAGPALCATIDRACCATCSHKSAESSPIRLGFERTLNCTDLGNAERLVALHGDDIRHCDAAGGWFAWDGARWVVDGAHRVRRCAYNTARNILKEAADCDNKDVREALKKHSHASESKNRIDAMIAQTIPFLTLPASAWDADPFCLNCVNGTIDLHTGQLRNHERGDHIRKIIPVAYDPDAKCPNWLFFLMRIFEGDMDMISFVMRAIGYTLTGDVSAQCLFFLYGRGANGKSTFIETLAELFGDYQRKCPNSIMIAARNNNGGGGGPTPEIADLFGVRMAHTEEIEKGSHFAESKLKGLTGGDTITARHLNKEHITFKPSHKLWIFGNDKPVIKGTDEGIWRRIHLIPFLCTIPEHERRANFKENDLLPELPGILAWAVRGCLDWLANGRRLSPPSAVTSAVQEYRDEMDMYGDFLAECCIQGEQYYVKASDFYASYLKWAEINGIQKPVTNATFGKEMQLRFKREQSRIGRYYYGVGLIE